MEFLGAQPQTGGINNNPLSGRLLCRTDPPTQHARFRTHHHMADSILVDQDVGRTYRGTHCCRQQNFPTRHLQITWQSDAISCAPALAASIDAGQPCRIVTSVARLSPPGGLAPANVRPPALSAPPSPSCALPRSLDALYGDDEEHPIRPAEIVADRQVGGIRQHMHDRLAVSRRLHKAKAGNPHRMPLAAYPRWRPCRADASGSTGRNCVVGLPNALLPPSPAFTRRSDDCQINHGFLGSSGKKARPGLCPGPAQRRSLWKPLIEARKTASDHQPDTGIASAAPAARPGNHIAAAAIHRTATGGRLPRSCYASRPPLCRYRDWRPPPIAAVSSPRNVPR